MSFVFGTGALFAAFLLICLGRIALDRGATHSSDEAFGPAETLAFLFAVLTAAGTAMLADGVVSGNMPAALIELAVSIGILVAACVALLLALRPFARPAPSAGGITEGQPPRRPRRPSSAPLQPAGAARRRAA